MDPVSTTVLELTTGGVQITWTKPFEYYQSIDQYEVQIADSSVPTGWNTISSCSGTQSTGLLESRTCIVDMSTLWVSPFSLA